MINDAKAMKEHVDEVYESSVSFCHILLSVLQRDQLSESELTDIGFLLRESEKFFDDARKEVKAKKEMISKMLALKIMKRYTEDPDTEDLRSRGTLATATPDVAIRPKLPKAGTPEYEQLLNWLGEPIETINGGTLNIHFNRMSQMLTRMAEEGKNPPPGLVGTYTDNTCVFRRTNNNKGN
tara:strand:+ start:2325 stop:2867 length:543 start_codon:yes stop_codon:yes gene_type:complete